MSFEIKAGPISGTVTVPPSKSHSMRAILFASMAYGQSKIYSYLDSPDVSAMISACRAFGAQIEADGSCLRIEGVNGKPQVLEQVVDAGNSGQVLRFIGAIAGLIDGYTVITGDYSLRYQRPIAPLISGLNQLGCFAVSAKGDGYAPLIVKGPMQGGDVFIEAADSQPVSGLIMAACFAKQSTRIQVSNSGELPWIQLTLSWLNKLGLKYQAQLGKEYQIEGGQSVLGFDYRVVGDFSSAAF
jgi:3-phosphoshikimate 1-carboxyvinyltransferase